MKISDVLRRLADNIDGHAEGGQPDPAIQNPAQLSAVPTGQNVIVVDTDVDNKPSPNGTTASGNDKAPAEQFLPPLQMKQELLKKSVGVENVYDDGTATEQDQEDQEDQDNMSQERDDIVNRIKQLSGIPTAAIQELGNDEVFDD
mgnify:CR=1 FL=1|jgi:hypothetical protein|tara:strand:- start:1095 stop:1529 length:435 start_codon:yes stop_codon:yes gene_type:complete